MPVVDRICLHWGPDRLFIQEPSWCRAIQEEASDTPPDDIYDREERFSQDDATLVGMGFLSIEEFQKRPKGLRQRTPLPITTKCLKEFLGLELPAALVRHDIGTPTRFLALHARLEMTCAALSAFQVNFVFEGLQLYANGHIGRPMRLVRVLHNSAIQRRTLNNTWCTLSFDGSPRGPERIEKWQSTPRRDFFVEGEFLVDEAGTPLRRVCL